MTYSQSIPTKYVDGGHAFDVVQQRCRNCLATVAQMQKGTTPVQCPGKAI